MSTNIKREPWHPALWELADASAIQAMSRGEATADQQRRAIEWIVKGAAMTHDETFVAGQADVSAFLAGRRSVGNQVLKLLIINISAFRRT